MQLNLGEEQFWSLWLKSKSVQAFERGQMTEQRFLSCFSAEIGVDESADDFRDRLLRWQLRIFPGVTGVIGKLREDFDIALLSNTNVIHWDMVRGQNDFERLFDRKFLSFETGLAKPGRAAFELVLESVAQKPQDIHFFDDAEHNVAAAEGLGIVATRVDGQAGLRSALRTAGFM
jgi:HAD superfamily hydrolase (TIGR01509 family)